VLLPAIVLALTIGAPPDIEPFPAFALENFDGRAFSNATFKGKTTIVIPTYAKCVFACPMITFFLTELDKQLGSPADVQYAHVSVQPTEDTADEILEHFEEHGIDSKRDPRWLFINGPTEEVLRFLADTDVEVTRTQMSEGVLIEHTTRVFVVGPTGETLAQFDTYFWDKEEMRHALRFAINE
jgi:cytochrome oxidase Cu insertion factor (SCO1/SenC/PrrC family)